MVMNEHLRKDVRQLRERVRNDEYQVDSKAVADAIVRRRWAVAIGAPHSQTRVIASSRWHRPEALAA
jgi:Anti-sigma-28 factor, FlgM